MESIPVPRTHSKPRVTQYACYVGDPVAVIVAENLAVALDARDLVEIDYVPLPAVVDPEEHRWVFACLTCRSSQKKSGRKSRLPALGISQKWIRFHMLSFAPSK